MSPRISNRARLGTAHKLVSHCCFVGIGLFTLAVSAGAQSLWQYRGDGDRVAVEVHKPFFEGGGQPFPASVTFLGARKLLWGGSVALVTDLPVVHARIGSYRYVPYVPPDTATTFPDTLLTPGRVEVTESTGTEIANPYLGLEFPGTAWSHELGIRIEHASRGHERVLGSAAEVERAAAFFSRTTTFHYGLAYRPPREPGVHGRYRFALLIPAGRGVTFLLTYRGMVERGAGRYRLGIGLAGIVSVDPRSNATLSERMSNQIEAIAEGAWGPWRPALHVRQWLDSYPREAVPLVIGLRVEWHPTPRGSADLVRSRSSVH